MAAQVRLYSQSLRSQKSLKGCKSWDTQTTADFINLTNFDPVIPDRSDSSIATQQPRN